MLRTVVAVLFAITAVVASAAELPEVKVGTNAQECTYIVADTTRSCETYFYLATPDGEVKVFILATPNGFGFIGSTDTPSTEGRHVFPVTSVRREEGSSTKTYDATGECAVDISGTGSGQSIAVECNADSDLGPAAVTFRDDEAFVMVR